MATYLVILVVVLSALIVVAKVRDYRHPRRVWDREHGGDVHIGEPTAEPTAEALARIQRSAVATMICGLVMLTVSCAIGYFEFDLAEKNRTRLQEAERNSTMPKLAAFEGGDAPKALREPDRALPRDPAPAAQDQEKASANAPDFLQLAPRKRSAPDLDVIARGQTSKSARLERLAHLPGSKDDSVGHLAVEGNHLYVAKDETLRIVDVSNPAKPKIAGSLKFQGDVAGVAVRGKHAYVLDDEHLRVVDVSKPGDPTVVASLKLPGGLLCQIALAGKYAYVTDIEGLRIVDISDPKTPRQAGACKVAEGAQGVAVADKHAYVATDTGGLAIVDVSDPARPKEIGRCEGPGNAMNVAVSGRFAYVADYAGATAVWIIDVSNPAMPKKAGRYGDWITGGVAVSGNHLFVAGGNLDVLDITDPRKPAKVASYEKTESFAVVASGDLIFVAGQGTDGLAILRLGREKKSE